jgi:predicted aminopeptidase
MKNYLCFTLFVLLILLLSACGQLGYYRQSVSGHLAIMAQSRPIDEILSDPEITNILKQKLSRAVEYRRYASDVLNLPDNDSYLSYADIGRPAAVWNVVAAPDDSLRPKQWCFAFVGCLPYRGYYDQAEAQEYAGELTAEGFDVMTYGVPAYSTLGWFDDPLLNTLVDLPDWALAGIMFHELAHQLVYVEDDTIFNEAFAQMVEEEGWRRWLSSHGTDEGRALFLRYRARQNGFQGLLKQTREALQSCYGSDRKHAVRLECKQIALDLMQQQYVGLKKSWGGYSGYDTWFKSRPNNAHFVSSHTYRHYVPAFETLLHRQGGDLRLFYTEVKRLAELSAQERRQIMEGLLEDEKPPL